MVYIADRGERRPSSKNCLQCFFALGKLSANCLSKSTNVIAVTNFRQIVAKYGLNYDKPAQKPGLTMAMKETRLEFARNNKGWIIDSWGKVSFLEESCLQQFD